MKDVGEPMIELFRVMTRLRRAWHEIRPAPEISKSLFTTLMAIAHSGDISQPDYVPVKLVDGCIAVSDLAAITNQSLPTISQRVKALEECGYLARVIDEADRRICRVRLTESGNEIVEKAHIAMKTRMDATMKKFGEENVPALLEMLNLLAQSIEQTQDNI